MGFSLSMGYVRCSRCSGRMLMVKWIAERYDLDGFFFDYLSGFVNLYILLNWLGIKMNSLFCLLMVIRVDVGFSFSFWFSEFKMVCLFSLWWYYWIGWIKWWDLLFYLNGFLFSCWWWDVGSWWISLGPHGSRTGSLIYDFLYIFLTEAYEFVWNVFSSRF